MAVGFPVKDDYATGDVLTAANMNDFAGTLNTVPNVIGGYAAGKNKIINGDFRINQRAFTSNTTSGAFNFDRWFQLNTGGTVTATPQLFTAGTAPVAGYEAINFLRVVTASQSAAGDRAMIIQAIEDVRTFANQTITVSFWAKAASGTPKIALEIQQTPDPGGTGLTRTYFGQATLSTNWTRYSLTGNVPSLSGKTIVANNSINTNFFLSAGSDFNSRTGTLGIQNNTFDIWGVQVEAGSIATPFQTATGTIQGELAACQRYYQRYTQIGLTVGLLPVSPANTGTSVDVGFVPMTSFRVIPTSLETANIGIFHWPNTTTYTSGTWAIANSAASSALNGFVPLIRYTHGSSVFTAGGACVLVTTSASLQGFIGLSAEL